MHYLRHYAQISEALHNISNDVYEKQETQTDAHALSASLGIWNVVFIAYLTGSRLQICNYRKLTLISAAAFLLSSLWEFVMAKWDHFKTFKSETLNVLGVSKFVRTHGHALQWQLKSFAVENCSFTDNNFTRKRLSVYFFLLVLLRYFILGYWLGMKEMGNGYEIWLCWIM